MSTIEISELKERKAMEERIATEITCVEDVIQAGLSGVPDDFSACQQSHGISEWTVHPDPNIYHRTIFLSLHAVDTEQKNR